METTRRLFAMPWVIGFLVFTAGPMLFSLYASFTRYNIIATPRWIVRPGMFAISKDSSASATRRSSKPMQRSTTLVRSFHAQSRNLQANPSERGPQTKR